MANPTRRGFLTMAAGLAAQPKGALSSPKATLDDIPASIKKLIPDLADEKNVWFKEGAEGLPDLIAEYSREWFPGLSRKHGDEYYDDLVNYASKLIDGNPMAYVKLKEMGASQSGIKSMLKEFHDEAKFFYDDVWPSVRAAQMADPQNPMQRQIQQLEADKFAGYLRKAGYLADPIPQLETHGSLAPEFDTRGGLSFADRPLPAPSIAAPGPRLNLEE